MNNAADQMKQLVCPDCHHLYVAYPDQECPYCLSADNFNWRAAVTLKLTGEPGDISRGRALELIGKMAQGSNYVVNKESRPTCVWFKNGRKVWIRYDKDGAYLNVDW